MTRAADEPVPLVFRGGADLSFRDGFGAKRRVLRGEAFLVDPATAALLLSSDATITTFWDVTSPAEVESVPLVTGGTIEVVIPIEPEDPLLAFGDELAEPTEPTPPVEPEADRGGPIVLGDLPASARLSS